jgi:hypothetical protein
MKRIFTIIAVMLLSLGAMAQTVENIRVEQDGENILVHYRIGGSTDAQTFKVLLSCSIDGGRRFEPITVIGDVGENIRGGKSNYTITWDVFEDLDEIGEAEFFVSVDLSSGPAEAAPAEVDQAVRVSTGMNFYLAYTGSTGNPYGLSTGMTFGKWGGYFSFRYGISEVVDIYMDWRVYVLGVMRRIVEREKYGLYLFAGAGAVNEYFEVTSTADYLDQTYMMVDGGIINTIGRVSLTIGVEYTDWVYPVFGVGYMFPLRRKVK